MAEKHLRFGLGIIVVLIIMVIIASVLTVSAAVLFFIDIICGIFRFILFGRFFPKERKDLLCKGFGEVLSEMPKFPKQFHEEIYGE
jgi:hypothetical protein